MRVFRPPQRPSKIRTVLCIVVLIATLVPVTMLVTLAMGSMTITYSISGDELRVETGHLLDSDKRIALSQIEHQSVIEPRRCSRTAGTALPGYCAGSWSCDAIGPVWLATDCQGRGVLLKVRGEERPVLLTPPDPDEFLQKLSSHENMTVTLPGADTGALRMVGAVSVVLVVGLDGMLLALFVWGPNRMRYLVGEGRLEVRTIFSTRSWAASDLRARPHTPKVGLRLAGTAMPGYFTGLFRADGVNTRLYATDLKDGVLIEGPVRVYLSPQNREEFLAALKQAGAFVET